MNTNPNINDMIEVFLKSDFKVDFDNGFGIVLYKNYYDGLTNKDMKTFIVMNYKTGFYLKFDNEKIYEGYIHHFYIHNNNIILKKEYNI